MSSVSLSRPGFRSLILCIGLGCLIALAGCASWGKEPDKTRNWSAQKLYSEAKAAMNDGDYFTAVDYYEKLESRFPFGPYASQAQLEVAYAFYKNDEPESAIAAADRFIKLHPRHPSVDYAYYLKGLVNFNRDRGFIARIIPGDDAKRDAAARLASFQDFAELTRRFPESKYSEDARQRMLYLRNSLARHEVYVADYYFRRGAYVAAVNRAKYAVENFPTAPVLPDALAIMVKAYAELEMTDLAADALRVLKHNYPAHPGLPEVEGLAQAN
ncbi:MAG: outer membrane protein assembly factor BamD [Pseudomonadota bacterium]